MSDGDGARQAQDLRDHATSLLQDAARCGDPVRRDRLLRQAVARLNEARLLMNQPDAACERLGASHPAQGIH